MSSYPVSQVQRNDPSELKHPSDQSHGLFAHSSISVEINVRFKKVITRIRFTMPRIFLKCVMHQSALRTNTNHNHIKNNYQVLLRFFHTERCRRTCTFIPISSEPCVTRTCESNFTIFVGTISIRCTVVSVQFIFIYQITCCCTISTVSYCLEN